MAFIPKTWHDLPDTSTPVSAASLVDSETRLSAYTDSEVLGHKNSTTNVHGITNTANLATSSSVTSAVSSHNSTTTSVHGIANTANLATTSALSNHEADTTNIHGIADTSALATNTALSNHAIDTTDVHGIADTSLLATQSYVQGQITNLNISSYATDVELSTAISNLAPIAGTLGFKAHGATANAARPIGFSCVVWIGSVTPINAIDGDLYVSTD